MAASPVFRALVKGASGTILTVVTDLPQGDSVEMLHEIRNGELTRVDVGSRGAFAERKPDVTITGSYEAFRQLQQGTLTPQAAYFTRLVRLSGDLTTAARFLPAFVKFQELVRTVETTY